MYGRLTLQSVADWADASAAEIGPAVQAAIDARDGIGACGMARARQLVMAAEARAIEPMGEALAMRITCQLALMRPRVAERFARSLGEPASRPLTLSVLGSHETYQPALAAIRAATAMRRAA